MSDLLDCYYSDYMEGKADIRHERHQGWGQNTYILIHIVPQPRQSTCICILQNPIESFNLPQKICRSGGRFTKKNSELFIVSKFAHYFPGVCFDLVSFLFCVSQKRSLFVRQPSETLLLFQSYYRQILQYQPSFLRVA